MSILAWWVVPVAVALFLGAVIHLWGRRPRFRRSFEDVEGFHSLIIALKPHCTERARRGGRSTA